MELLLNCAMLLVPPIFALFLHNYFCHGKMSSAKKFVYFIVDGGVTDILMYVLLWVRNIRGNGILRITVSHKLELMLIGCVFAFFVALCSALIVEEDVTVDKLSMYLKRFANDLKKYFKYAIRSAKSDLRSEVANAYLDWLWWLIEPFCMMLIYTLIFGVVFNASEEYFPIFIFSGLAMWSFFSRGLNVSVNIVRNNKSIISRVYLPKFILYFARMLVNGFKMLVSFGIVVVMMLIYRVPLSFKVLYIIPIMIVFFLFTFGLGSILMHFGVYVNDLSYIIGIVLSMLMYFTGTFYSVGKRIPEPFGELLEQFNPVAYFIASMRNALLYCKGPQLDLLLTWGMASVVLAAIGVYTVYRNENAYVKVI
ncbi:MAG: ABC transporter permease [Lachnospiraceae bacterium]|nr:ABC transporter permease [Lachnospiraceae bacterium]